MKTKFLSVLALLAVLVIPVGPARASDAYEKYTEWYSDATKTEMVGWRQEYCDGTADSWGYQSAYRQSWNGNRCVDGGGSWQTWCSIPAYASCPASCAWCTYYNP